MADKEFKINLNTIRLAAQGIAQVVSGLRLAYGSNPVVLANAEPINVEGVRYVRVHNTSGGARAILGFHSAGDGTALQMFDEQGISIDIPNDGTQLVDVSGLARVEFDGAVTVQLVA